MRYYFCHSPEGPFDPKNLRYNHDNCFFLFLFSLLLKNKFEGPLWGSFNNSIPVQSTLIVKLASNPQPDLFFFDFRRDPEGGKIKKHPSAPGGALCKSGNESRFNKLRRFNCSRFNRIKLSLNNLIRKDFNLINAFASH